ncbi:hypothetical protein [Marinagarivorans algicola]|uniref:hypothetical protein n=1 Tax=Marinagarivorans algicola TaxID=1513270 RepID=UPI0006B4C9E2|nr:hypothetical protein [Marinagarivorans algicola]
MKKLSCAIMLVSIGLSPLSNAEINFRGFGSIVGGQAMSVEPDETVLGYGDTWDFKQDSLMAFQMNADLEDGLTATLQLVSRGKNDYEPQVRWAYLSYQATDSIQVSAGRTQAPFYRYSDFLDVRYTYNWITGPDRVYNFDYPSFDGVSILYSNSIGAVDSTFQFVGGVLDSESDSEDTAGVIFEDFYGASWVGTWEFITGRLSYLKAGVTLESQNIASLVSGYESLGAGMLGVAQGFGQFAAAAGASAVGQRAAGYAASYAEVGNSYFATNDKILAFEDDGSYVAVGFSIDKGSLIIDSEFIQYDVEESLIEETTAYYITVGWRVGPTVVYGTYSREEADAPVTIAIAPGDLTSVADAIATETALPSDPVAAFGGATLQQMAIGLAQQGKGLSDTLASNNKDIVNLQLGMRWDFHPSAAFKVSYENTENKVSGFKGGVLRTAIDLVF